MTKLFIRARSIDGTVYWAGDGWSNSVVGAAEIRNYTAGQAAIRFLIENAPPQTGPDDVIGQFQVVDFSDAYVGEQYDRAMEQDAAMCYAPCPHCHGTGEVDDGDAIGRMMGENQ